MGELSTRVVRCAAIALLLCWTACSSERVFTGHGVIHDVSAADGQILIEHEEMPGFMAAMTMNFDVVDAAELVALRPGQIVDFEVVQVGRAYRARAFVLVGEATVEQGWIRFGDALVRYQQAPDFELRDAEGSTVKLASLQGRVLFVDFVYTRCPGPCPILTSTHIEVQRALSESERQHMRFMSIGLDPERDDAADLQAYATARGADPEGWVFLSGTKQDVDTVLKGFGVGASPGENGEIEHMVLSFLLDGQGRVVKRYFGVEHTPAAIVEDLRIAIRDLAPRS